MPWISGKVLPSRSERNVGTTVFCYEWMEDSDVVKRLECFVSSFVAPRGAGQSETSFLGFYPPPGKTEQQDLMHR
jgi:hypothetical protein